MGDFRRRVFEIGEDARLAAVAFGDPDRAPDIVFLHANGFNALTYRQALEPLGETLSVLALDMEGHGRSPQRRPSENQANWLGFRDDLLAVLDQIGGAPVLAGHSMGGATALLATIARLKQVRGLALFDPVIMARTQSADSGLMENALTEGARRRRAGFPSRGAAIASYRGRGGFRTWPDPALVDYAEDGFRDQPDGSVTLSCAPAWEAANFAASPRVLWPGMETVMAPVVILKAQQGSTCRITGAAAFSPENHDVRIETVPGTTHFLPIERPDLVGETLRALAS